MNDTDLYSAVFDIVNENMTNAGEKFMTSKECFVCSSQSNPRTVDILRLSKEKDNGIFLEKAYTEILKRPVDERAYENWKNRFELPPQEFQNLVINSIVNSQEYYNSQVRIYNNIYSKHNSFGGNISGVQPSAGITMPEKLMNTYRKMPDFMKKIAKKAMGVK